MLNARIKLRHLQAFMEVARARSFARAAERLAITQPGISKTIRELEETLDVVLFERTPRGVSLTQAGLTLLRHAGPALRTLEEGIGAVGEGRTGAGWLRIGALSTVESRLMPEAIRRWQVNMEGDSGVSVVTGPSAFLLSRLRRGELDLVVGRMTAAREILDLNFEHLFYERLLLVVREGHPLAENRSLPPRQLSDYPWVLPPPQTTLRQQVDSFFVRHGLEMPEQPLETLSLPLGRGFTLGSDAVWVVPEEAAFESLKAGELVELPLTMEHQGGSVGLCTNASLAPSLALDQFCQTLRAMAAEKATAAPLSSP
jgi:LysR family pca operon transcriptional activator